MFDQENFREGYRQGWRQLLVVLLFVITIALFPIHVSSQVVQTYEVSGSWACPDGVTNVKLEAWGAGAGGRSASNIKGRSGGGGGGGAYAVRSSIAVASGVSYNFIVGAGGISASGTASTAGGATSAVISGVAIVAAGGSSPAGESSTTGVSTGGVGGGVSGSVGDVIYAGGNGGSNFSKSSQGGDGHGGGGGGGAGTTTSGTNGGNGTSANGGSAGIGGAVDGGTGGVGGDNLGGSASIVGYGGGGGGAGHKSTGGNGQNGAIRFTYTCPVLLAEAGMNQTICQTSTSLSATIPSAGSGTWTVQSGAAMITSPNSPSTTITNVGVGTATLRWTVTNGSCGSSFDEVTVTRTALCNDDCADATVLTIDASALGGSTSGATTEPGEVGPCGGVISRSVWYKFTATGAEHTVNVTRSIVSSGAFYTAVYKGTCSTRTQVSCLDGNFSTSTPQKHHLKQLTIGEDYLVQLTSDANAQSFDIDVDSGAEYGNDGCNCYEVNPIVEPGTCFTDDLGGAAACLASGCQTGSNSTTIYTIIPSGNTLDVSVDNLSTSFLGDVEVRIYTGTCSLGYVASSCGAAPYHHQFTGLTAGTQYKIFVSSSANDGESSDVFGICVSDDAAACGVNSGCGEIPPPGDPILRLALNGQGYNTEAVIRFKNGATSNYDVAYDALYFPSNDPSGIEFATVSADNRDLVINSLDVAQMAALVPIMSETNTAGVYTIEMTEFTDFPADYSVYLIDTKEGVTHLLNDGSYSFQGDPTDAVSRFQVNTASSVLPVDLVDFKVYEHNRKVYAEWVTLSEVNCDYFILERSRDMESWEKVARVFGAGSSNSKSKYVEIDYSPLQNTSYYRLTQVDFDGSQEYSLISGVHIMSASIAAQVVKYGGQFRLLFDRPLQSDEQIYIYNLLGQAVADISLRAGQQEYVLPEGVLSVPGEYFVVSESMGLRFKMVLI